MVKEQVNGELKIKSTKNPPILKSSLVRDA